MSLFLVVALSPRRVQYVGCNSRKPLYSVPFPLIKQFTMRMKVNIVYVRIFCVKLLDTLLFHHLKSFVVILL